MIYKDKQNRFLRVNAAFEQAMGHSKRELEGRSLFDIYPREQAEAYWRDDLEVIQAGGRSSASWKQWTRLRAQGSF